MTGRRGKSTAADTRLTRARQVVTEFHSANPVPGTSVAVFDSTRILFHQSVGVRAVERPDELMSGDTVFRLYSLTKMITALAAVRLADSGRLSLDDPVVNFFPASARVSVPMEKVTVRQLLSHRSGLPRGEVDLNFGSGDNSGLSQDILEASLKVDFVAEPGVLYSYSDQGFAMVGYVIERCTGKPFAVAMRDLVFKPLGMIHSSFDPLVAMTLPLSQQHVERKSRGITSLPRFADSARMRPYSGAFCSARDLCRIGMLHLGSGIAREPAEPVISAEAIGEMRVPQVSIGLDIDLSYGLGAYIGPRFGGEISYGHEGYYVGSWCKLLLCPGAGLGLAWCDNRGPSDALTRARLKSIHQLLAIFGAGELSWQAAGPQPATAMENAEATGSFRRAEGGGVIVHESAGQLRIADSAYDAPLVRYRDSVFAVPEGVPVPDRTPWKPHAGSHRCCVNFIHGRDGSVAYLSLNGIAHRRA